MRQNPCSAVALIALGVLNSSAAPVAAQSEPVRWRADAPAAMAEAQQSGKLVLLHFWTETCGPCRALEKRVFSQPQVASALETNYVPVKVNANKHPDLARAYNIRQVPTDAVVTPRGELVKAFVSPPTPMGYIALTSGLASDYRSRQGAKFASAAAQSPYQGPAGPTSTRNAYSGLVPASPEAPATSQPFAPPAVAPHEAVPQPATPPQQTVNPHFAVVPATPVEPEQAAPASVAPAVAPVEPVAPAPAAETKQAKQPAANQQAGPALPPGSPPLAFDGFCPVTMKSEWRWAQGDVRWGAIHLGRTYLFSSEKARDTFLAKPEEYSPVLSGADPVVAVDEQRVAPGTREHAVEYEGRFYMFSSEATLNKFWTNARRYAEGATRVAGRLPADGVIVR